MHTRIREEIAALARATPAEVCGFIYRDAGGAPRLFPCANTADDPVKRFEIDVRAHIRALHAGTELLGVYHSHVGEPEGFTEDDLEFAEHVALPQYLCNAEAPDQLLNYLPPTCQPPLEGRAFTLGFHDCFELPRIYYRQKFGHYLADYERDESFRHEEQGTIMENYAREGFALLAPDPLQVREHDILMFRTERALPQHFGIFIGQNRMLHHPLNALSRAELITDRWWSRLHCIFRRDPSHPTDPSDLPVSLKNTTPHV